MVVVFPAARVLICLTEGIHIRPSKPPDVIYQQPCISRNFRPVMMIILTSKKLMISKWKMKQLRRKAVQLASSCAKTSKSPSLITKTRNLRQRNRRNKSNEFSWNSSESRRQTTLFNPQMRVQSTPIKLTKSTLARVSHYRTFKAISRLRSNSSNPRRVRRDPVPQVGWQGPKWRSNSFSCSEISKRTSLVLVIKQRFR